jgi:plasmid stability protein
VEDDLHFRLKAQAAAHWHSLEEELRLLQRQGLAHTHATAPQGIDQAMRTIFEPLAGFELSETEHEMRRDPPDFSGPEWGADR